MEIVIQVVLRHVKILVLVNVRQLVLILAKEKLQYI